MGLSIDHFVWAASDLDHGNAIIEKIFGVQPMQGGSHPGLGTRNSLVSLGPKTYLEVIAPDLGSISPNSPGDRLRQLKAPGLMTWVYRSDGLNKLAQLTQDSLSVLTPIGPIKTQRETADGEMLAWELLFVTQHEFGGLMPFFIDWQDTAHPSLSAPYGGQCKEVRLRSPDAALLNPALNVFDVDVPVTLASEAAIEVEITTSTGNIVLTSTAETLQLALI